MIENRIVGGKETTIAEHPYIVSLQLMGYNHKCGGSIISKNYVLTAAHCVTPYMSSYRKKMLKIRAGSSMVYKGGSIHNVDKLIVHEKFSINHHGAPDNDIALIKVKPSFKYGKNIQPISLHTTNENITISAGNETTVTGWGSTASGKSFTSKLRTVDVPIVPQSDCNTAYRKMGGVKKGKICAGRMGVGGRDSCQGDSGGPLILRRKRLLIGIVSYGIGCGRHDHPGVYTHVQHYDHWIVRNAHLHDY